MKSYLLGGALFLSIWAAEAAEPTGMLFNSTQGHCQKQL